jgi:hypothetical protein
MNLVPNFSKSQIDKINDAKDYEIIKQVHIDSIFRKDYLTSNSSDFLFEMPEPIKNVMIMKLITIELPNTFYQFTEKNNAFRMVTHYAVPLDDGTINPSYETIVTIPPGSYPAGDLMALIQNFFDVNGDLQYLAIEVDDYTSKTTIRFKTADELTIDFDIDTVDKIIQNLRNYYTFDIFFDHQTPLCVERPEYETVGWTFGYRKLFYTGIGYETHVEQKFQSTFNGALVSEGIFGANKMNYTFLCVNDFNRNSRESIITGNGNRTHLNKDILSRVTIKFGSFFVNLDAGDNVFRERHYGGPVNIDRLQLKLIDKYGNPLDLNGSDWSAILEFICVR